MRGVTSRRFDPRWGAVILGLSLLVWTGGCGGDESDGGGHDGGVGWDGVVETDSEVGNDPDGGEPDGSVDPPSRWIELDGVVNSRDVGGYEVAGGHTIRWRRILRGGTLSSLTPAGCTQHDALAVATVIDLRMTTTQTTDPPPTCVTDQVTLESVPMPKILPASVDNYLLLMDQTEAEVVNLFQIVGGADPSPIYVHCVIGRDRASWAIALLILALGADRATVLTEFGLSNDVGVTVVDAHMEAILDAIDAAGGIEPYLTGLGVTQAQVDNFRAWALH